MLAILSPAKTLDYESDYLKTGHSVPDFLDDSGYLVNKLKKKSARQLKKMMGVSEAIATLNVERFNSWNQPFTEENARPAIHSFKGEVYRGLDAPSFSEKDLEFAQSHLRILSGLYGLLRPLDLMQPYRLEMGTSWAVTPKKKNLYTYWDNRLTESLNNELEKQSESVLVNLASNEYFKAVKPAKLNGKLITCHFKEAKGGEFKMIMTFAKQARGLMARYMIQNRLEQPEDLKSFDLEGYSYNDRLTKGNDWVFTRG